MWKLERKKRNSSVLRWWWLIDSCNVMNYRHISVHLWTSKWIDSFLDCATSDAVCCLCLYHELVFSYMIFVYLLHSFCILGPHEQLGNEGKEWKRKKNIQIPSRLFFLNWIRCARAAKWVAKNLVRNHAEIKIWMSNYCNFDRMNLSMINLRASGWASAQ